MTAKVAIVTHRERPLWTDRLSYRTVNDLAVYPFGSATMTSKMVRLQVGVGEEGATSVS